MRAAHVSYVNETEGHMIGDEYWPLDESSVLEDASDGEIFRFMRDEFGRCVSKVYVGAGDQVGWVFQSRQSYEDVPSKTYIREVWVALGEYHPAVPEHITH